MSPTVKKWWDINYTLSACLCVQFYLACLCWWPFFSPRGMPVPRATYFACVNYGRRKQAIISFPAKAMEYVFTCVALCVCVCVCVCVCL